MIIPDTSPIFPACPKFGFTSEPRYLVKIVTRDGGFERRDRKWSRPLHRYTGVPIGEQADDNIQELLYFWHAVGGMSTTFRFTDYADYKSCRTGQDPTELDQPFVALTGESYQMMKVYSYAGLQQLREIKRPHAATAVIANEANVIQNPVNYSIDESTGIVTTATGFDGTPTSWGGLFYVPCRFDSEFPIEIANKRIQSVQVAIAEVRE